MPKTLLLADDSVTIQKVVGITFANEDVDLVTVDNGNDALQRAREIKPDIVLADVSMPGLDGYALSAAIKSEPELARIPVLLLTGTFERFDEVRAAESKVDGYVAKPFEAQALVDQVHRLIEQAATATATAAADRPAPAATSSETAAEASNDFSFDDLAFEPPAQAAPELTHLSDASAPDGSMRSGISATDVMAPNPADELTRVADILSPLDVAEVDTPPSKELGSEDSLFEEGAVLEALSEQPADVGALVSEPRAATDVDLLADSGALGESAVLGDLVPMEAEPLAAELEPISAPLANDSTFRMHEPVAPGPEEAELAWAQPVSNEADAEVVEEPEVVEEALEELEPAAPAVEERTETSFDAQTMNEVLEKLAWEAFGPLSEQLVREVVQKVESLAWEIVPQLAERLIQEEIKRMKAHTSD